MSVFFCLFDFSLSALSKFSVTNPNACEPREGKGAVSCYQELPSLFSVIGGNARGGGMEEIPKINGFSCLISLMFLQASASFSDSCVALLGPSTALKTCCLSWRPGFVSMTCCYRRRLV